MVKYMKLFNDIRNFIEDNSFKIIIYNNKINIINYKEIIDITPSSIQIRCDKIINVLGEKLCIIKLLDKEILIKGIIRDIKLNE